jgi:hypothetical protein
MWHRIFCRSSNLVEVSRLCEFLVSHGFSVNPNVRGDELGWTEAELVSANSPRSTPISLCRYLTKEDDLRADLNSFAAELESYSEIQPQSQGCMEHVIQTQQLITFRKPLDYPNEIELERLCKAICHFFAIQLNGLYQVDGQGWMNAEGVEMVHEY